MDNSITDLIISSRTLYDTTGPTLLTIRNLVSTIIFVLGFFYSN